jgi:hypothetical protein
MIKFIIAGWFLARFDYYKMLKSQQEFTELTLYFADVEHNNKTASFIVNDCNYVCTDAVDCTENAQQIFGGKMMKSFLFTTDWSGQLLFLLSVPCRRCCLCDVLELTKKDPPSHACFYSLQSTI